LKILVAFSSPKRSAKTLEMAAQYAKAVSAELVLLRVLPDPREVGVVAELIASDRPADKAKSQLTKAVEELQANGLKASSELRVGQIARTILATANELGVDMIFVGTTISTGGFSVTPRDPVVNYLVENSTISVCVIKHDPITDADEAKPD
jgi:nucleotide-binding universal stress UspA family protein